MARQVVDRLVAATSHDHRALTDEQLMDAARHLDSLGIPHQGVKDIGQGYILEFRDPDNVALELMAPA